jgi:hypothetical protein
MESMTGFTKYGHRGISALNGCVRSTNTFLPMGILLLAAVRIADT